MEKTVEIYLPIPRQVQVSQSLVSHVGGSPSNVCECVCVLYSTVSIKTHMRYVKQGTTTLLTPGLHPQATRSDKHARPCPTATPFPL